MIAVEQAPNNKSKIAVVELASLGALVITVPMKYLNLALMRIKQ